MKKTNIALAIFSAIALAACGGSSNDDAVDNSSNTGTVQPGINNGNTGSVQPGNNGNTNTNTGDTNTNTGNTNTNTGNNNAGNNNAGNNNAGNNNAGNTNTGTTTPTKPTDPKKPEEPKKPTDPKKPEEPKKPMTGDVTGAEKIGLSKGNDEVYAGFIKTTADTIALSDGKKYLGARLSIDASTKQAALDAPINKVAYVQAPNLLNDKNELTTAIAKDNLDASDDGFNVVANSNITTVKRIAYMDGDKFKQALAVKGEKKLYKQKADGSLGDELSKDQVYQKVALDDLVGSVPTSPPAGAQDKPSKTTINSINVFDQPLQVTTVEADNEIKVSEFNRGSIEQGKVIDSSIKYNVRLNSKQLKLNDNGTKFVEDENAGVTPNLTRNVDVTAVKLKAYNLPFVMTTFSFGKDGINDKAGNYLSNFTGSKGNVLFYGNRTINLPTVIADYQGQVFTPTSTGDLNMTVELDDNQVRFHKVDITGRSKSAPDLQLRGTPTVQSHGRSYLVNLKRVDDVAIANGDIHALVGDFYGLKAENTAGTLVDKFVIYDGDTLKEKNIVTGDATSTNIMSGNYIGAFAAEKK